MILLLACQIDPIAGVKEVIEGLEREHAEQRQLLNALVEGVYDAFEEMMAVVRYLPRQAGGKAAPSRLRRIRLPKKKCPLTSRKYDSLTLNTCSHLIDCSISTALVML